MLIQSRDHFTADSRRYRLQRRLRDGCWRAIFVHSEDDDGDGAVSGPWLPAREEAVKWAEENE